MKMKKLFKITLKQTLKRYLISINKNLKKIDPGMEKFFIYLKQL